MGEATKRLAVTAGGFTLLELIVALAVGALVVVGLHAAVSVSADVAARSGDRAAASLRVEAARSAIGLWLGGAYVPTDLEGVHFDGRDSASRARPLDQVTFVTLDPGPIPVAFEGPVRIRLRVEDRAHRGLVAEYVPLGVNGRPSKLSMLPEVGGMNVRYLVSIFDELLWLDEWSSEFRLPRGVEFRFYAAPGTALPRTLEAPLFVTLPRYR